MKKINRRIQHGLKYAREDPRDDRDDDNDSDDESEENNGKIKERFPLQNYVLIVLVLLFGLSYLYERDLRFRLIEEFNLNIDKASSQLYECKKNGNGGKSCPECPECERPSDIVPAAEEEEESKVFTDAEMVSQQWETRHFAMIGEIQRMSKELLTTKFGPAPYYVEINIMTSKEDVGGGKLLFEMAPVDLMPYSLYYFLSQVSAGVWNSCRLTPRLTACLHSTS